MISGQPWCGVPSVSVFLSWGLPQRAPHHTQETSPVTSQMPSLSALPQPRAVPAATGVRWFHSGAALVLCALVFAGFHRFYTQGQAYPGRELAPPIRTLLIVHGTGMTAWMLLAIVQPLLVALRNMRLHRTLGTIGALLALAITVPGWLVGTASARIAPPDMRIWGLTPPQFMIVPIGSLVLFAGFVAAGIWARRRPDVHRPMMFLATLSAASAGIGRIDALNELYAGTIFDRLLGPFFTTLAVGGLLLAARCVLTRAVGRTVGRAVGRTSERPFVLGFAVLVAANAAMVQLATSELWAVVARALLA